MPVTGFRASPFSNYRISFQCCRIRRSPFTRCLAVVILWVSLAPITAKCEQHRRHTFQPFSYAGTGFPNSDCRLSSLALFLIHRFLSLGLWSLGLAPLPPCSYWNNNMLHSPSGFPSRISCRIIGCDFSSLDTFAYRLLKAVFHKNHVTKIYNALVTYGRTQLPKIVSAASL